MASRGCCFFKQKNSGQHQASRRDFHLSIMKYATYKVCVIGRVTSSIAIKCWLDILIEMYGARGSTGGWRNRQPAKKKGKYTDVRTRRAGVQARFHLTKYFLNVSISLLEHKDFFMVRILRLDCFLLFERLNYNIFVKFF